MRQPIIGNNTAEGFSKGGGVVKMVTLEGVLFLYRNINDLFKGRGLKYIGHATAVFIHNGNC